MSVPTSSDKARFVGMPGGAILSNQSLTLQTGGSLNVSLSANAPAMPGFPPSTGIGVTTDGGPRFTGRVNITLASWQGGAPTYRITGFRNGPVRLVASRGANVLDSFDIKVIGQEIAAMTVLDALDGMRLGISADQAKVLRDSINGSQTVVVDQAIIDLLAALLRQGSVDVLSLLRRGESQHGVVQGSKVICKAVDISGFAGTQIISNDAPDRLIDLVCRILASFPDSDLDIGFPRPVGGPTGFDPSHDVFFNVPDQATAQKCFDGTITLPLSAMRHPAQGRVAQAMGQSRATFHLLFPDGLNHLHVSVTKSLPTLVQLP
jgi:hypothetical protein